MKRDIGYLSILKTGPGTSIQDTGRVGFAELGVPISGGLDHRSLSWANHLLKNKETDAVMEINQPGLKIKFDTPTLICVAGAKAVLNLNGSSISKLGIIEISTNDLLEIGAFQEGAVLYLGIKNGFQTEKIMNSRSWFKGISRIGFANKGEQIPYFTNPGANTSPTARVKWDFNWSSKQSIDVYPGPEWGQLDRKSQETIEATEFTISDLKNRMAIQLEEILPNSIHDMATAPVFPGTIQLTSGGKLIILMRDAQVTGGYPRILQVSEEGLCILAQKNPRQKIRFRIIKIL